MTNKHFMQIIENELDYCKTLLTSKGHEYAPNCSRANGQKLYEEEDGQLSFWSSSSNNDDRLRQFKKAAAITGETTKKALFGMLVKHLISLAEMCYAESSFTFEKWQEKITDSINYMLLLYAIILEEDAYHE